ncbi:MAG: rhodanese-like domain-containing protein [Trueperaceae bacterium]
MSASLPEIDVHEARARVDAGATFVDVREPDEHAAVRTPDAQLLPLSTFLDAWSEALPRDHEIVVLCRSGARSGRVTAFLLEQGLDAVNVEGGILAWEREGLPVEKG